MSTGKKEKSLVSKIFIIFLGVVLTIYTLSLIVTLIWGFVTSLKSDIDFNIYDNIIGMPNLEWSREQFLHFKNYIDIFSNFVIHTETSFFVGNTPVGHESTDGIFSMLINTLIYAGIGAFLHSFIPAIMGYMCAKYKNVVAGFLYALNLIVMIIPLVGTQSATISVLRALNLYDNYAGILCLKFTFMGTYFIVFHGYFEGLPDSYSEAAEIDGASQFQILLSIILPLTWKMIATVFLIQFVALWNDYQTAMLYMPTHPTLAYGVYFLSIGSNKGTFAFVPAKTASCMMLAIPILIIFIIFKDKLMGNVTMGGIKG